jgi:hypothetical protein
MFVTHENTPFALGYFLCAVRVPLYHNAIFTAFLQGIYYPQNTLALALLSCIVWVWTNKK